MVVTSMIIVAGRIYLKSGRRDSFVRASLEAVALARKTAGCLDFVVAPDPVEPDRVNVFERWESRTALEAFRGDGPGDDLSADILNADVTEYEVVRA